jgi:hypothetical protein
MAHYFSSANFPQRLQFRAMEGRQSSTRRWPRSRQRPIRPPRPPHSAPLTSGSSITRLSLFIVHDLNPRVISKRIQGFASAQSWFLDLKTGSLQK